MKCKDTIQIIKEKLQEILVLINEFDEEEEKPKLEFPEDFSQSTKQLKPNLVAHIPYNQKVGNNRWMSETINNAYIGTNAWGFGGNAGGTQELENAYVEIYKRKSSLDFVWWVGGYHLNYNGKPEHGWWTQHKGGNDVKAYPRIGIGSASGQPVATTGAPFDLTQSQTNGWKHVNQDEVRDKVGIPEYLDKLPEIKINFAYQLTSAFKEGKDKFGNYFVAVDSYLHDISKAPNGIDDINGITDTSGEIYGQQMKDLPESTKEWAVMIWTSRSPYYETSGGKVIGEVEIQGLMFDVKYKIETASDKKFKYLAFVNQSDPHSGLFGTFDYNKFVEFYTSDKMQKMFIDAGPLEDIDGAQRIIQAPTVDLILSDINFGVEVLSNPDSDNDLSKQEVNCKFSEITFDVEGYGKFGFES